MAVTNPVIFQIQWFPYIPEWLAPTLLIGGFTLFIIGYFRAFGPWWAQRSHGLIITGLGGLLIVLEAFPEFTWLIMLLFFTTAKWFEGVGIVRFLNRFSRVLGSSEGSGSSLTTYLLFSLVLLFVVLTAAWVIVYLLIFGPVESTLAEEIAVTLTVTTALLAVLGMSFRLCKTARRLPISLILGFAIAVAGAEVYSFNLLGLAITVPSAVIDLNEGAFRVTYDLIPLLIGQAAYSVGFWFAVVIWISPDTPISAKVGGYYSEKTRHSRRLREGNEEGRNWCQADSLPQGEEGNDLVNSAYLVLETDFVNATKPASEYPEDVRIQAMCVLTRYLLSPDVQFGRKVEILRDKGYIAKVVAEEAVRLQADGWDRSELISLGIPKALIDGA